MQMHVTYQQVQALWESLDGEPDTGIVIEQAADDDHTPLVVEGTAVTNTFPDIIIVAYPIERGRGGSAHRITAKGEVT